MKKIKLCLFLLLSFSYFAKAQTCASPLTANTDGTWRGIDSFATSERWFKFTADHDNYKLKFYVKNYSLNNFRINLYTNNCAPLTSLNQTLTAVGDSVTVITESLILSRDYLIQLRNDSVPLGYRTFDLNIDKNMFYTQVVLGCSSSTCAAPPSSCELVCNGSFECLISPVTGLTQINKAANWTSGNTGGTPDLFVANSSINSGVPCNGWGEQYSNSGNSYAGIIVTNTAQSQFYEYLETQLSSALVAGKTYVISMYVSKSERSKMQIKNLGIYLTPGQVVQNSTGILPITPKAIISNISLLNDHTYWQRISFCYAPTVSGDLFLTIGPASISLPNVTNAGPSVPCPSMSIISYNATGYLYVDDVSVQELKVDASISPTICPNTPSQLNATPNCSNYSNFLGAAWSPTTGLNNSGLVNPVTTLTATQNYNINLYYTGSNNVTCSVTGQQNVNVYSVSPITITATSTLVCPNQSITLSASGGGSSTYTWQPGGIINTSISVSPTVATVYSVSAINATGCLVTATVSVAISPPLSTLGAAPQIICNNLEQTTTTLTANGVSGTTYTWVPGNLTGSVQIVTSTISTIYTVNTTYESCVSTITLEVIVSTACCNSTITAFSSSSFPTTQQGGLTYQAPIVFNSDITIPPGQAVTLSNAEYLFAPNVKLIVSATATLSLRGAHLYACRTDMWQGIEIQNDGWMETVQGNPNTNLIEDAIIGVNISGYTASSTLTSSSPVVSLRLTTFNKNYIGVKIDNFVTSNASYPLSIKECVFTSRDFTFSQTSWPTTSTSDLRSATNSTTGLASPYTLQNAAFGMLKPPYSIQSASVGILINNTGTNIGGYFGPVVGAVGAASDFNLFDNLHYGIYAINSNLSSVNNVYQNTYSFKPCRSCATDGGSGIKDVINNNFNAKLNLTATGTNSTSTSMGNRFWNCHRGVEMSNVYVFDCKHATFRSTQAKTATSFNHGNTGISAATNRFQYTIRNNNFNNINTGINMPITAGTYTFTGAGNGILAGNLLIESNYFGAHLNNTNTIANEYMNYAINMTAPNTASWLDISGYGLGIATNTVNRAFRGVYLNGYITPAFINDNQVQLVDDAVFNALQSGVRVVNSTRVIIKTNTLTAVNTTNTLVALVYSGLNTGQQVLCNTTSNANTGFQFDGAHAGTNTWKGNIMQSHAKGFVLSTSGMIGTQGTVGAPSDNQWSTSSNWTGTNYMTYVDFSNATNSKLYTKTGTPWEASNNFGNVTAPNLYSAFGNTISTTGTYGCGGGGSGTRMAFGGNTTKGEVVISFDQSNRLTTGLSNAQYIATTGNFRYLMLNDSIRISDPANIAFCSSLVGTSIDKFMQVETNFYNGNTTAANAVSSAITATNDVEANYKVYYTLYSKYASQNFNFADSTALYAFAQKCPGIDGACVYQARALYNTIYDNSQLFTDNCSTISNERKLLNVNVQNAQSFVWDVKLYPNPASKQLSIVGSLKSENLRIIIKDVTGKIVLSQNLTSSDFIAILDLNLTNGVYLITLSNTKNESITEKLVIAN